MQKVDFGGEQDVAFYREGKAGIIHLTRTKSLNALSHAMLKAIDLALTSWETDDSVACVLIEGEGKAFCSGGDVVAAYHGYQKHQKPAFEYMADEYRLNAYIGRYSKPYISFLDGIVMGGGAGISVHGSHRIVTENTIFAMPESIIGYFTDAGGGSFLSRLPDFFGIYLALTGNVIKWGDCLQTGLATHAVHAKDLSALRQTIIEQGDPRKALDVLAVEQDFETAAPTRNLISRCFSADSLAECLERLKAGIKDDQSVEQTIYQTILKRSPMSLKVIFRQLKECKPLDLDDCMRLEYRIANRLLVRHDFYEGIRAQLIDKDKAPKWQPQHFDDVTDEMVDACFQPLENELF